MLVRDRRFVLGQDKATLNRDHRTQSEHGKQDQNDIQRSAVQKKGSNYTEDRVSRQRRDEPLLHEPILIERSRRKLRLEMQEAVNMKPFSISSLVCGIVLSGVLTLANAQTVNQRRENQQDRIAQGINSGQLTPRETASLENKESRLNHQIRNDRRADNGRLTAGERNQINHEQNHVSRDIYRDKHNTARQ